MPHWLFQALIVFGTGIFYAVAAAGGVWISFKMVMRQARREEDEREAERMQWIETFLGEKSE